MKKLLLLTLIFILAACAAGGSELSRNREKWQDANITHYRFSFNISCFCAFRDQMPLVAEVLNGEIVSLTGSDGSVIAVDDPNYELFSKYATIDRLFSELEAGLGGGADAVTVTYDSTYGFPTESSIDFITEAADDELYLSASGLEALP